MTSHINNPEGVVLSMNHCPFPCGYVPVCPYPVAGPAGPKGATGALYLGKVTVCKNAVSIKPPRYGY